jgi:phosphate transport system substrate-binding protein
MDKIKGASVNGVRPSAQTIADGSYPLSRSLFIYVKKANIGVTPGLAEFLTEFTSDAASGRGGYLQGRGLIPLPPGQHDAQKQAAANKTAMARPAS